MKKFLLISMILVLCGMMLKAQTPIGMTDATIAIDGTREAAWDAAPKYLSIDPHSWCYDGFVQGWFGRDISLQSEEDFSLSWSGMWDATNLYLFFEFVDDVVTTGDTANMDADTKLWMNDNVEVRIGPYFYRFAYGRDGEEPQRPANGQVNPGGYTQSSVETTDGYAIEVQIPWATLVTDTVKIAENPAVDSTFMIWVGGSDLDLPEGKAWNDQDGHRHFPYDNGQEEIVLATTAAIDATAPAAPANLSATELSYTSVTVTWDDVAEDDLMGYLVYLDGIPQVYVHNASSATIALEIDNEYTLSVNSFDGQNLSGPGADLAVSTVPSSGEIAIGQTGTVPVIDATRETIWDGAPEYVAVDPTTWTPNPDHQDLEDCSFTWSALWDDDNLYIFVSILDDTHTTGDIESEGSAAISWMNDNVEVSIAPIDGEGDNWFFRFGYDRAPLDLGLMDDPPKNTPVGANYATADQEGGWVMEASIPWEILSIDPDNFTTWAEVDKVLNMSVVVSDLDIPDATAWDKLSGHVQWPRGWSSTEVTLTSSVLIDDVAPAAPTGLVAKDLTYNGATLSWTASTEEDVVGYLVLQGDAPKVYTVETEVQLTLSAATDYTYSVIAVDPQNLSEISAAAEFTTLSPPELKSRHISKYTGTYPNPFDDLELWAGLDKFDVVYGLPNGHDPADFGCSFKAMWDEDNLYMQITHIDPSPFVNGLSNPWENDNVEVHFDLQNAKDGTSCEDVDGELYQKDNMQYRFIAFEPERQAGSTPAPNWTDITQVYWELYDDEGLNVIGWYVEVTFPWSTLNATADGFFTFEPDLEKKIGVEIHSFDYDDDGSKVEVLWSSFSKLSPNRDNTEYGELILGYPTSVSKLETKELCVYPNPADDQIRLTVPGDNYIFTISDITGRVIVHQTSLEPGVRSINISDLKTGVYMVTLQNGNKMYTTKLIRK